VFVTLISVRQGLRSYSHEYSASSTSGYYFGQSLLALSPFSYVLVLKNDVVLGKTVQASGCCFASIFSVSLMNNLCSVLLCFSSFREITRHVCFIFLFQGIRNAC